MLEQESTFPTKVDFSQGRPNFFHGTTAFLIRVSFQMELCLFAHLTVCFDVPNLKAP